MILREAIEKRQNEEGARGRAGFTLIELAMVLVVIGILLTIGAGLVGELSKRAKFNETKEIVKAAREAVIGYATKNKRLPSTLASIGAKDTDAYGNPLIYTVATGSDTAGSDICCTNPTMLTVNDKGSTRTDVVFIVFSRGSNGNNETGASSPFNIYEQDFPVGGYNYDDIVEYVDINQLRETLSCSSVEIRTTSLPEGTEDFTYNTYAIGFGGCMPYAWSITSGVLPNALALDASSGAITGTINISTTPTGTLSTCSSISNFTLQVQDAQGKTVKKDLSILVYPQTLRITNTDMPSGAVGGAYSVTLYGAGGKNSYSWSISSGSLPPGLTLNPSTGVISGTPTTAGTYNFVVQLSDTCTTTSKAFTITVASAAAGGPSCSLSASPNPVNYGNPTTLTWSINNGPADATFSPSSGTCTSFPNSNGGTCTTAALTATTTFVLTITNANGTSNCSVTVTVTTAPPTCTLAASPPIVRYNETTALSWSITNGPADATFSPSSGTCTSFPNSTGGSCTTGALTAPPCQRLFTLTVSNAFGTNTCSTTLYVGQQGYRVWNNTGATYDFRVDVNCRNNIANNAEITTGAWRLNPGETINRYLSAGSCSSAVQATLTYDQAMSADSQGDCDGRVNFTGTDR